MRGAGRAAAVRAVWTGRHPRPDGRTMETRRPDHRDQAAAHAAEHPAIDHTAHEKGREGSDRATTSGRPPCKSHETCEGFVELTGGKRDLRLESSGE